MPGCLLLLFAKAVRLTLGSRVTTKGLTDRTDLNGCVGRHEISRVKDNDPATRRISHPGVELLDVCD